VIQEETAGKVVEARTNLAKVFVENELLESIFWMDRACTKCFRQLQDQGADPSSENRIWEDANSIVGWLVLLSVDHEWAENTKEALEKQEQGIRLEVPVRTDTGVEVVYSRIGENKADLCLDAQGEVTGRHKISRSPIEMIETGWALIDKVRDIKQIIWKEVFKGGKEPPRQFTTEDNRKLNTKIRVQSRKGKRYYLAVEVGKADNPLNNPEVYAALRNDLPDFQPVFIGIGRDSGVLVVDETDLGVYLSEFLSSRERT
jgi:hypothetical protein